MSEFDNEDFDFGFTGDIGGADRAADRITDSGAYLGKFSRVQFIKTQNGAKGMEFEFQSVQGGEARFTVYTVSTEGKPTFGRDQIEALAYLMGVKPTDIKGVSGPTRAYVDGKWQDDMPGIRYPALEDKAIGVVLQKELSTKTNGDGDTYRWNLAGQFEPTSRLTASEMRDRKTRPEKLDRIMRGLKDKDSRKKSLGGEPGQPSPGAGNFEGV